MTEQYVTDDVMASIKCTDDDGVEKKKWDEIDGKTSVRVLTNQHLVLAEF